MRRFDGTKENRTDAPEQRRRRAIFIEAFWTALDLQNVDDLAIVEAFRRAS